MTGKRISGLGLFLATVAAFALGAGLPAAYAGSGTTDRSSVDKAVDSAEGKAALAKAGISLARVKAALAKLTPEQKAELERTARRAAARATLRAKLVADGYTADEINERLALLADDEIARLAEDPAATEAGAGVGTVVFVLSLALIAVLVTVYFLTEEPPPIDTPPAK